MTGRSSLNDLELAARLEADRKRTGHDVVYDQRRAEYWEAERPVLTDLKTIGVEIKSLADKESVAAYIPFRRPVIDVFLRWLPQVHPRIQDTLVRLLAKAGDRFDATPLLQLFEATQSEGLRWAIGDTLALASPANAADWLVAAVQNPAYGKAREMLVVALSKLAPTGATNELLKKMFSQFPIHVAMALKECGGQAELEFLTSASDGGNKAAAAEMRKAIAAIEKRLAKKR